MSRRVAAVLALLCLAVGGGLLVYAVLEEFLQGLIALGLLALAATGAWQGLIRTGRARLVWWVVAGVLLVCAVAALLVTGIQWSGLLGVVLVVFAGGASTRAFSVHLHLPSAPSPTRAVVVYNVKSGGGKAVSNNLAEEARKRGITPRELKPGEDWERVVRTLVADGADGLMAAGGDGTQALVATWRPSTACPSPASRPAPATTSPSTSASTATTWSARWMPLWTAGRSGSTSVRWAVGSS